jgi:hypothetical protein
MHPLRPLRPLLVKEHQLPISPEKRDSGAVGSGLRKVLLTLTNQICVF